MKVRAFCVGALLMLIGSGAWADVFRCTGANGKTVYQESPCASGAQKALDDRDHRERERIARERKAEEDRKGQQAADMKKQWAACQADKSCVDLCYSICRIHVAYSLYFALCRNRRIESSFVYYRLE